MVRRFFLLLGLSLCSWVLLGCENTIDPQKEDTLYSIYGTLEVGKEVNYIRIRELKSPFSPSATREIDATATLTNLKTNASQTLKDTVVKHDQVYAHNFRSTLDIRPATEYRLTVERSDGATVTATAKTPPNVEMEADAPGQLCCQPIDLMVDPVPQQDSLQFEVGVTIRGETYWFPKRPVAREGSELRFRFTPITLINEAHDNNNLPPISTDRQCCYADVCCFQIEETKLDIRITHFGPDFYGDKRTARAPISRDDPGTFGALSRRRRTVSFDSSQQPCPPPGVNTFSCQYCRCRCTCITQLADLPLSSALGFSPPMLAQGGGCAASSSRLGPVRGGGL